MSWPVIAFAAAVLIFVVALVAWIALTADRHGSHRMQAQAQAQAQPRPARGRHQGAHVRRLRLWRHGDHGVPV